MWGSGCSDGSNQDRPPGADGEASLYHDDGETLAYERGDFWRAQVRWDDGLELLTLGTAAGRNEAPSFAMARNALTGEEIAIVRERVCAPVHNDP
jgi:hypothetical protein